MKFMTSQIIVLLTRTDAYFFEVQNNLKINDLSWQWIGTFLFFKNLSCTLHNWNQMNEYIGMMSYDKKK